MIDQRRLGWGLAALGMLLVSTDSLWVRLSEASGWDMAFLVGLFSLPVFLALNQILEETGPRQSLRLAGRPLLLVGVLAATSHISFITAITRTDVANVAVIVAASPIVAAILARIVLGERATLQVLLAMAGTGVGIAIVVGGSIGRPTLDGDLLALLAIVAFAASLMVWRRNPQLSRYVGLALSSLFVVALSAPFATPLSQEPRTYLAAAAMGLLFSPAGRIAHSSAPRFAPAAEVALFAPVEDDRSSRVGLVGLLRGSNRGHHRGGNRDRRRGLLRHLRVEPSDRGRNRGLRGQPRAAMTARAKSTVVADPPWSTVKVRPSA